MKPAKLFCTISMIWLAMSWQAGFAQTEPQNANEKLVRAYYTAFEKKDWNSMEQILADGFTFSSPLDDHIKLKAFKERCWPNAYNIKRFEIDKILVNGDVAFVITNGWTNGGKLFRNSDYFKLKDGKISEYECFFGPGINYPNSGK
jgi:ketosteroid isomerase-like protein